MPYNHTPAYGLHAVAAENTDALFEAASLLGGDPARRRCARLLAELLDAPALSRRLLAETHWLTEPMGLVHVGEPNRIETDLFSRISPDDPLMIELCCLHNALADALAEAEPEERAA